MIKVNFRMAIVELTVTLTEIAPATPDCFGFEENNNTYDYQRSEPVQISDEIYSEEMDHFGDYRTDNRDAWAWAAEHMPAQPDIDLGSLVNVGDKLVRYEAVKIETGRETVE